MLLEDMLGELGCEVVAISTHLDEALGLAQSLDIDFALLDINLDGHESFPVADVLRERGVPFLFATGYGAKILKPPYSWHTDPAEAVPARRPAPSDRHAHRRLKSGADRLLDAEHAVLVEAPLVGVDDLPAPSARCAGASNTTTTSSLLRSRTMRPARLAVLAGDIDDAQAHRESAASPPRRGRLPTPPR